MRLTTNGEQYYYRLINETVASVGIAQSRLTSADSNPISQQAYQTWCDQHRATSVYYRLYFEDP